MILSLVFPIFLLAPLPAPFAATAGRRAAIPQGWPLLEEGPLSCCSSQALSLARLINRSSCVVLTFLLTLRLCSKGFCIWSGEESGLFCSFPCRFQRRTTLNVQVTPRVMPRPRVNMLSQLTDLSRLLAGATQGRDGNLPRGLRETIQRQEQHCSCNSEAYSAVRHGQNFQ